MSSLQRRALIVGCPDEKIPAVNDDMRNYRRFFESAAGGGWLPGEITTLKSPSVTALKLEVQKLTLVDYSVVVFAGHGGYLPSAETTMLTLSPGVQIDEFELKLGAPRRTVIIDSCRVLIGRVVLDEARASLEKFASAPDVQASRRIFDSHLRQCHPGLAVMYACSIGESAEEEEGVGGYYSASLINEGKKWGESAYGTFGSVLTVDVAHEMAAKRVQRQTALAQNPRAALPRATPRFPFAVHA